MRHKSKIKYLFKYFFVFALLLIFFLISIIFYILQSDLSFTTLSNFYSKNIFSDNKLGRPLKKGEVIKGEFIAKENNLGIIAIAFDPRFKTWDDVIFRIKEKGSKNWYYSNKYWALQFLDFEYFPFGFPLIKDSRDKIYQFELKSLVAKEGEGVAIRKMYPSVVVKYQFDKNQLLMNKTNLIQFLYKKLLNNFFNQNFIFIFITSIFPLVLYSSYLFNKSLAKILINSLPLFFFFWDIFFVRGNYIYISFLILFLLMINFWKDIMYFLVIILLILLPLTEIINLGYLQYKVSYWFIFTLIAVVFQDCLKLFLVKRGIIKT